MPQRLRKRAAQLVVANQHVGAARLPDVPHRHALDDERAHVIHRLHRHRRRGERNHVGAVAVHDRHDIGTGFVNLAVNEALDVSRC